jgi:starch-binding outer membrane protein, SusD/RagB family
MKIMKRINKIRYFLIALTFFASCTKLDEKELLYDTVIQDNFLQTDAELASAVAAAYAPLYGFGGNNHQIPLNEVTTDEIVVPTRGADWGDGGHWVRLQQHTYKKDDPTPNNGWNFCYNGILNCNKLVAILETSTSSSAPAYIAELKALRAIYYYWLLDWFGRVPVVTDFNVTTPPANKTRAEVYAFVEQELTASLATLPDGGPQDGPLYGRVTKFVAQTALAKLYLNAQVYTGTAQWDKCIAACDAVINSNKYSLSPNYSAVFSRTNTGNAEIIWAVPYDGIKAGGFNLDMMTLHLNSDKSYNINAQPWNGFATIQEFYQSYIDPVQNPGPQGTVVGLDPAGTPTTGTLDKRMLNNFLVGPQYATNGSRILDGGADVNDPDGAPLTFTPYINELQPNAWRQSGARIGKFGFYNGMTANLDNDWPIFRFGDILLMKAEATARKNNNWNDGVTLALVNQIRARAGVDPLASLTASTFAAERGREMFIECFKRQDMIRFGTYNSAWRFHPADASTHVNLFPIPETQLNANPNLTQNPGY